MLFVFLLNGNYAQQWSDPINISDTDLHDSFPDMCIDSNGTLHCVWKRRINDNTRKVYYSYSTDKGDSWSAPQSVSQNNSKKIANVKIVCDSQNNLHILYLYDTDDYYNTQVRYQRYNGQSWSTPLNIAPSYPGALRTCLAIDNNNRVYTFWIYGTTFYYKYFENNSWSDVICPYYGSNSENIKKIVTDNSNNLHCVGGATFDGKGRKVYFKYDYSLNEWSDFIILNDTLAAEFEDICLDNNDYPHIVWRQYQDDIVSFHDATVYAYFNGTQWTEAEVIVEDPYGQLIHIINNNVYIIDLEKEDDCEYIVFYHKSILNNQWVGEYILNIDFGGPTKLLSDTENMYLLISGKLDDDYVDIYLMKIPLDSLITCVPSINYLHNDLLSLYPNYPNPFRYNTSFSFELLSEGISDFRILDIGGKTVKTLVSSHLKSGKYTIGWDGKDDNGNMLKPGVYYYRLKVNKQMITKSLILMN